MSIAIYTNGNTFSVFMCDNAFWEGDGYCVRFDCSASELQGGIKKALALYESR